MTTKRPALDVDLYSDAALADPYPLYRAIRLLPGGWAARLFEAADAGEIEPGDVPGMLIDYGRVRRIEVGEATVELNNVLRGYGGFRVSFRREGSG